MPEIKQISIKDIFERANGHKLPDPTPTVAYIIENKPTIAGNLNTK